MSIPKHIEEMNNAVRERIHEDCSMTKVYEALYDAGYRKQRKGEWKIYSCSYECSICKEEFVPDGYAEDYDPITDWDLHYCPNCGAKMKGE